MSIRNRWLALLSLATDSVKSITEGNETEPPFWGWLNICYKYAVFRLSKMFAFVFHIFIWPDDLYRISLAPEIASE